MLFWLNFLVWFLKIKKAFFVATSSSHYFLLLDIFVLLNGSRYAAIIIALNTFVCKAICAILEAQLARSNP